MLRAMIPPWQRLDDPLIQYDIRYQARTGRRPWAALILAYLTLLALVVYFAVALYEHNETEPLLPEQLLGNTLIFLGFGLSVIVVVGHWRLLFAVAARAAAMIAQRKRRGDWDLIAITPMSKARWFRSQLTVMGWQVFPLIRQLIFIQTILVILLFSYAIYFEYTERQEELERYQYCVAQGNCLAGNFEPDYVPTGIYTLMILPFGLLLIAEPIMTTGIFALVSLNASSRSQLASMSILYSLFGVYLARVVMTFVLSFGGIIVLILVTLVFDALGITDSDLDFSGESWDFLITAIPYCCAWSLAGAFFIEWIPALIPLLLLTDIEADAQYLIATSVMITFTLAYILTPLMIIFHLTKNTVFRLNLREP